jgi:hypothetical protein
MIKIYCLADWNWKFSSYCGSCGGRKEDHNDDDDEYINLTVIIELDES